MSNKWAKDSCVKRCCNTKNYSSTCSERRTCTDCEIFYKNYYNCDYKNNAVRVSSADKIICLRAAYNMTHKTQQWV